MLHFLGLTQKVTTNNPTQRYSSHAWVTGVLAGKDGDTWTVLPPAPWTTLDHSPELHCAVPLRTGFWIKGLFSLLSNMMWLQSLLSICEMGSRTPVTNTKWSVISFSPTSSHVLWTISMWFINPNTMSVLCKELYCLGRWQERWACPYRLS